MSGEDRQKIVAEWGAGEGEGAPPKVSLKGKEKDEKSAKVKDKENGERDPSPRSVTPPVKEVVRSGLEQPKDEQDEENAEGRYRDIMAKAQKDYEDLELIAGVPVSQVSQGIWFTFHNSHLVGLAIRSVSADFVPTFRVLGAFRSSSSGIKRVMVRVGRHQAMLLGAGSGDREGI